MQIKVDMDQSTPVMSKATITIEFEPRKMGSLSYRNSVYNGIFDVLNDINYTHCPFYDLLIEHQQRTPD